MLHNSKMLVFDSSINNKVLTKEVFQQENERLSKVTYAKIIGESFKSSDDYHKEANVEFVKMV